MCTGLEPDAFAKSHDSDLVAISEQGSSPSVPEESKMDVLGRSLSGSIQIVSTAVAGIQGIEQLDNMLARVDDATAVLVAQDAASRAPPAPQGRLELANSTPIDDPLTGRE